MQEAEPFAGHALFFVIILVVVVGFGDAIVNIAQQGEVFFLVLDQVGIVLQGLDGRLRLLHVQVDHADLLIGHRVAQLVLVRLGVFQHPLGLLESQLQLTFGAKGVGLELPDTIVVVPLLMRAEPLHLDCGLVGHLLRLR